MRHFIFQTLFIFALCLCATHTAFADCVSDCQASTYCDGSSYECAQLQNACYLRECSKNNAAQTTNRVSGAYGAIAYDKESGAYGMADASQDKKSARESALSFCGKHGDHCKIVSDISKTCAAIAQNPHGTVAGWADDSNKIEAGKSAVKSCNKKDDNTLCHITLMNCYAP